MENILGKGENGGYNFFSFILQSFHKAFPYGQLNYELCGKGLK